MTPSRTPLNCADASDWHLLDGALSIRPCGDTTAHHAYFVLRGAIDASGVGALARTLRGIVDDGIDMLSLDMADVGMLDVAGTWTLASTARTLEARGGRLRVLRPGPRVSQVLVMTGLGRLLMSA